MFKEYTCLKLDGDKTESSINDVVEEVPLSIFINGRHFVTAMISPSMREEFVIGHLFSERIVSGINEVESLEIEGNVARAIVENPMRTILPRRPIVSGCGGISSFLDESKLPEIRSDMKVERDEIYRAMKAISLSLLHEATGGVHSVGLFGKAGAIFISEDIGRHNALDKVIGYGLTRSTDFSETFAASTGRISSDMALKCSVAGIPIIASRGATTSLAISIAERTGLSIIGFARGKRMNIYSNPWRVEGLEIERAK
ncbi:MAG: formate dehydrogenase accessory sulfurtransferase FdhD [Methanotrichaceae archaeon]